jgi:hypothetical protein
MQACLILFYPMHVQDQVLQHPTLGPTLEKCLDMCKTKDVSFKLNTMLTLTNITSVDISAPSSDGKVRIPA